MRIIMLPVIKGWRKFSKEVEHRLKEKEDEGYTGWDGDYSTEALQEELTDDALQIEREGGYKDQALDVAARAMMLWHRMPH